jgi:hypothetical protein
MSSGMVWSAVWGAFTAFVISPAFDLTLTQNVVIAIIGALAITAFHKETE